MPRDAFKSAMDFFLHTTRQVGDAQWELPGLGEWAVRELVAHTTRAMLTVAQFATGESSATVDMSSSAEYYRVALAGEGVDERIAERGRQTALELGADLPTAVARISGEAASLLDTLPDDHIFTTLIGGITLVDYLPTRTLELVVHTLDLQAATGIGGDPPRDAMRSTLHLLAEMAVESPHASRLALLATGRDDWRGPFSVLGAN